MASNKAPQSKQAPQISSNSSQPENVQNRPISGLCGGDNPTDIKAIVRSLRNEMGVRMRISNKYVLHTGGYDLLLIITDRWVNENIGSTAYALAREPKNCTITATSVGVAKLLYKGLVEVMGYGNKNSKVYGPTIATLVEFGFIKGLITA